MDAIISGRAGVAFLVEGEVFSSFDVEDPATLLPRRPADLRLLFGEAPDIQFLEDVDRAEVEQHLERAFNCASALDLALILFDLELPDDIRDDAADELERLMSDKRVVEYLENILYGKPLPADADIEGALSRCMGERLPKLSATLQILEGYQPAIRSVRVAWDELPAELFGGDDQKTEFQNVAVREGLFRRLATEVANDARANVNKFILLSGTNPSITSLRGSREVLQQWTNPFRLHATTPRISHEVEEFLEQSSTRKGRRGRGKRRNADEELNKLQGQLNLIVDAMRQHNLPFARKITDEVVKYQSANAKPIHVAMTLCNLATEAKALGIYPLQLELTERAISIVPDDAWSWAQYADALLKLQRPTEALRAYEQAEAFGAGAVAKNGRAETLRALGRLPEALAAYDDTIAEHPKSVIAKSGRAETLRALGRLSDALAAYDSIVAEHPENVVAKHGRAEVLKASGRLNEALAAYDDTIAEHPKSVIAKNGRAETLRALNRLPDALDAYNETIAQHPEDVFAKTGRAETLRALGQLNDALDAYNETIARHPENVVAKTGRAETLRALNRLPDALDAYNETIAQHPEDVFAKTGRAETLRALGQLNDALDAYNETIARHPENVVAKTGRAETLRALNRLPDALDAYNETIAQHPEDVFAKTGRAETLRALGQLNDALDAYNETIARHPENVVAKRGRAEVLKALGRLDSALAAYDAILAGNAKDSIARNGRCGVLIALRRYDDALESLPDKTPTTRGDWIGYHIRGMILLRKGKIDEAIKIFEHGVKDDPIPSSKEYFRNALAVACLRRKDFSRAESALEGINTPLLQPQANVLRFHTFGASGKDALALAAYEKLSDKPWFISDELMSELHRRYILKEEPRHDDEWIIEKELDTFLYDPNQQVLSYDLRAA